MLYIQLMRTADALKYYKSVKKIAAAIGISRGAVYQWGDVVPYASAAKLEKESAEKLTIDESLYKSNRPLNGKAA